MTFRIASLGLITPTLYVNHLRAERPWRGSDELSRLAGSINEMLEDLEQSQHRREESERKYRTLFRDSTDAVCIVSPEGKALDANPSALEMFGYPEEELIGLDIRQVYVNPDDWHLPRRDVEQKGWVRNYEARLNKEGRD